MPYKLRDIPDPTKTIRHIKAKEKRELLGMLAIRAIRYAIKIDDPFVTTRVRNWYTE